MVLAGQPAEAQSIGSAGARAGARAVNVSPCRAQWLARLRRVPERAAGSQFARRAYQRAAPRAATVRGACGTLCTPLHRLTVCSAALLCRALGRAAGQPMRAYGFYGNVVGCRGGHGARGTPGRSPGHAGQLGRRRWRRAASAVQAAPRRRRLFLGCHGRVAASGGALRACAPQERRWCVCVPLRDVRALPRGWRA